MHEWNYECLVGSFGSAFTYVCKKEAVFPKRLSIISSTHKNHDFLAREAAKERDEKAEIPYSTSISLY